MTTPIKNRYEFVILFDVTNGNPNGDPDAGNMPRVDPETGHGLVSDVCLKRKIRNYVETVREDDEGYKIYIKENVPLNRSDELAYTSLGIKAVEIVENNEDTEDDEDIKVTKGKSKGKDSKKTILSRDKRDERDEKIRDFMCLNFFDIRTFGAIMTTFVKASLNCGQVRGPVQIGFARSIDPVVSQEVTITRMTVATEKEGEKQLHTMGNKFIVPYALYQAKGYISANLARKSTGFSDEDLEILWEAIINMFEHDRSAARGDMVVRKLIVFKHDSELGNAQSHKLFETISVKRNENVEIARTYEDYTVSLAKDKVPAGVEVIEKV